MSDTEFRRRVKAHLRELQLAYRDGKKPNISEFLSREPDDERHVYLSSLIQEDFIGRVGLGESPWVTDYFGLRQIADARAAVCRSLTEILFENEGELARRLGVLDFKEFRAIALVGFGGFGAVLKAHHRRNVEEVVAIKVAHSDDRGASVILGNEFRALQKLKKIDGIAGVPLLIDSGKSQRGWDFLVMSWVAGQTIDTWRRLGPGHYCWNLVTDNSCATGIPTVLNDPRQWTSGE